MSKPLAVINFQVPFVLGKAVNSDNLRAQGVLRGANPSHCILLSHCGVWQDALCPVTPGFSVV